MATASAGVVTSLGGALGLGCVGTPTTAAGASILARRYQVAAILAAILSD